MTMLAGLGKISRRWDNPDTPWWRRHEFGFVLFGGIAFVAAVGYSLITWSFIPGVFIFGGPLLGAVLGHSSRQRSSPPRRTEPELRPSHPGDADTDPWRNPVS